MKTTYQRMLAILLSASMLVMASLACGNTPSATSTPVVKTATPAEVVTEPPQTKPTAVPQTTNLSATPAPPTTAPTATNAPTMTPNAANLGDLVEQDEYFIQATAVEDPATPGPFFQAESGKKLVAVELVVGNVSGTPITVNPLDAVLVDGDGFTYHPELGGRDGQIELLELNPGERVKGWIAFQIPNAAQLKSIKFDVSGSNTLKAGLTPPQAGQTAAQLPARSSPTLPKLGDLVEQDGYSLSASKVEDPAKPGAIFSGEKGKRLVAVEVVIGNVSGAQITVNPLSAVLVDTDGFLYQPTLGGRDGQIDLTDLNPGEKAKGWISFLVPPKAKLEGIRYNMSGNITLETGLAK
jgi:hypothetical protein